MYLYKKRYGEKDSQINFDLFHNQNGGSVQMVPIDGKLYLKIINTTGQHDKLYAVWYEGIYHTEAYHQGYFYATKYPLVLNPGDSILEDLAIPTEERDYVYWDFHDISTAFRSATHVDSFYVGKGDTVRYMLKY
jgi:hypothetical protein